MEVPRVFLKEPVTSGSEATNSLTGCAGLTIMWSTLPFTASGPFLPLPAFVIRLPLHERRYRFNMVPYSFVMFAEPPNVRAGRCSCLLVP